MSLFKYPPIMIISGTPGTGKTTIARKMLKDNSDYIVIEQVDIMREVLRVYINNFDNLFEKTKLRKKYIKIMEILNRSSYVLSNDDYLYQCKLLTPAIIGVSNRLYLKGIPLIIEGVNVDIQTIISSLELFEAKSNEILFIHLFINNDQYKKNLERKLSDYAEYDKIRIIKFLMDRNIWLYNRLNEYIVSNNTKNIFNIDLSNNKILPYSTDFTRHILSLSSGDW